jgi:hypothetical protein
MVATLVLKPISRIHQAIVCAVLFAIMGLEDVPRAQSPVPISDRHITYILPQWGQFLSVGDAEFSAAVQQLRARIGEGPRVRVGFTLYVQIEMTDWNVDVSSPAAVRAALAPTIARLDAAIARAHAHGIPFCASFLSAVRGGYDPAEGAAELEDRRNMQWYADNSLAAGWVSHSQYARKLRRVQEAYMRELGRIVAARMRLYPDTFVAASGDGEIELSPDKTSYVDSTYTPETSLFADYSPFAVAEFRDWLRAGGLYAPGQPLAGQGYELSGRYAGDTSPASDSSGDGHTLDGDFGTAFSSWDLAHFDWSLSDVVDADAHAIPAAQYNAPGFNPLPAGLPVGFDAPRVRQRGHAWWDLWDRFRQTMIWRHNRDIAKWITTSPDPQFGNTVPIERWFSDQIPADYLFGGTVDNPNFRLETSASPWWTADVSPYGSIGITAFNVNFGGGQFARTLVGVAPQIAARHVRWGIVEWNPSVPALADPQIYRDEMAIVERYRPSLLVPFMWGNPDYPILDTGFEVALRELVARIGTLPLTLSQTSLNIGATANGVATPPQIVRVSGAPGEQPPWAIASSSSLLDVRPLTDGRSFSVALVNTALAPGDYSASVVVSSSDPGYTPATLTVTVRVAVAGASVPPRGSFDAPADNAVVTGEVAVSGWALDDIGIAGVDVYRSPVEGEGPDLVFVGAATLVDGARPDVAAVSPTSPMNTRAGWGYMLLTNMLPGGGNAAFTIWAVAHDYEGRSTMLGSRRIDVRNSTAWLPFGTIDTPAQGATVSGTIINFGWALTPLPNAIPSDGSTIGVYVDGLYIGAPTYNNFRPDIATLFPGYKNSAGAVGYFVLDTRTFANGVHTIAWVVRDGAGNTQGIGSRFFTIDNP